jgi:[ribosomal protein S5]-alanine N-acetyltransferase
VDTIDEIEWSSPRLRIEPILRRTVEALISGWRLDNWAPDFPTEGDLMIARGLHRSDRPSSNEDRFWSHYHLVELSSGLVVGGIGFHGPPKDGEVEVGYGIVPSRRGLGFATEAVVTLLALTWSREEVLKVIAGTDRDNLASQRVLEKSGFDLLTHDGKARRYGIRRPPR